MPGIGILGDRAQKYAVEGDEPSRASASNLHRQLNAALVSDDLAEPLDLGCGRAKGRGELIGWGGRAGHTPTMTDVWTCW